MPKPTIHPGQILKNRFMEPLGLSARQLGLKLGVPQNRISAILNGERDISADTALRLARAFGTSAQFWTNLQAEHDLREAENAKGAEIATIAVLVASAALEEAAPRRAALRKGRARIA